MVKRWTLCAAEGKRFVLPITNGANIPNHLSVYADSQGSIGKAFIRFLAMFVQILSTIKSVLFKSKTSFQELKCHQLCTVAWNTHYPHLKGAKANFSHITKVLTTQLRILFFYAAKQLLEKKKCSCALFYVNVLRDCFKAECFTNNHISNGRNNVDIIAFIATKI